MDQSSLAVLATDRNGLPYTNLIGYLLSRDFKCLFFFTPKNTMKYKNIEINPNVSILIDNRDKNYDRKYLITAVTVIGRASILKKFDRNIISKFMFYYPELTEFTKPGLNVLIKIDIDKYILVSELQKVVEVKP